jgi:S1-C subfamily serine protease
LEPPPQPGRDDVRNLAGEHPLDGSRVSNILPGVADELGLEETGGVVIISVRQGSIAARLGFRPGDIPVEIGGQAIESVTQLEKTLSQQQRVWMLSVKRGDKVLQLKVPG